MDPIFAVYRHLEPAGGTFAVEEFRLREAHLLQIERRTTALAGHLYGQPDPPIRRWEQSPFVLDVNGVS